MNHGDRLLRTDLTEAELLLPPASPRRGQVSRAPAEPGARAQRSPTGDEGEDVVLTIELICDPTLT
ncbi:hypothetical protein [Nocardia asiatica]|uniref:hypothetical protein n=1 Tax=Nocardia asiatica TaxID=209252 RepID=UPI002458D5AC|nr:hypothetical protein [Nocardia asiatica]